MNSISRLLGGCAAALVMGAGGARASVLDHNIALSSLGAQAFDNGNWVEQSPGGAGWQYDAMLAIDDDAQLASGWAGLGSLPQQQMWVVFDKEYLIDAVYLDELSYAYSTSGMLEYRQGGAWLPLRSFSKDGPDYLVTFDAQRADAVRLTVTSASVPPTWLNVASVVYSLEVRDSTSSTCSVTVPDADGDGEADSTDACPQTPAEVAVDSGGCSQAQFCAGFDATTKRGARTCKVADWENDEPVGKPNDCTVDRGGKGSADDRCVPR